MVPTATDLSLRDLRTPEEIDELREQWDGLVASASRPSPYLLASWVSGWLREYADDFEPCITVAARGSKVVGISPFVVNRDGRVRVAEFVGRHESALADILLAPGEPIATAAKLLGPLAQSGADVLNASGLPGDSVLARAAGDRLHTIPRVGSPVLEMPDGWPEVYERRVSKDGRSKNRGAERRLNRLGSLEVVVAHEGPEVAEALDEAFVIHRARWQGRPDGSSFGRPERARFTRRALVKLAEQGRFAICIMRLDGRGIAFSSWFEIGTTLYGHRTAYDPALSRYGAGQIVMRHGFAAGAERGMRRIEFLGETSEYNKQLSDRLDPTHQGMGLARGLKGRLYVARTLGVIEARKRLKKHERLHRLYRSGALRIRRPG